MRIGVLGLGTSVSQGGTIGGATLGNQTPPDITGTIVSSPPIYNNGATYGTNNAGDTIYCPPGFPYDATIKDCRNYAGSPADVAAQGLQAQMDACSSGGGTWDPVNGLCVFPTANPPTSTQLIAGIDNRVLYGAAGLLLLLAFMGGRR